MTVAHTTGVAGSGVTTCGGDVVNVTNCDDFAATFIGSQDRTQGASHVGARQAATSSDHVALETRGAAVTRGTAVVAAAQISGQSRTEGAVGRRAGSASFANVFGIDVETACRADQITGHTAIAVVKDSEVGWADHIRAWETRIARIGRVSGVGPTVLHTRQTFADIAGVGSLTKSAVGNTGQTLSTVTWDNDLIEISTTCLRGTRHTRITIVDTNTSVVSRTGAGVTDDTRLTVIQETSRQIVFGTRVAIGNTTLRIGARDALAGVGSIDRPVAETCEQGFFGRTVGARQAGIRGVVLEVVRTDGLWAWDTGQTIVARV